MNHKLKRAAGVPNYPPGTWLTITDEGRAYWGHLPAPAPCAEFMVVGETHGRHADCRRYFKGENIGYGTEDLVAGVLRFYRPTTPPKIQQSLLTHGA